MEVIPLLHLRNGEPVVGTPEKWRPLAMPYPDGGDDVAGLARHLSVRFGSVAMVDLGTGRMEDPHHNLYQKLAKQHVQLWADAFPESLEDLLDLFVSGAQRVTARVDRMDLGDLAEVLDMADGEVWLGYPFRERREVERLFSRVDAFPLLDAGAAGLVLIDLGAAGRTTGFDASVLPLVPYRDVAVHVAGGIGTREHVMALKDAGVAGVHIGTALLQDLKGFAALAKELGGGPDKPADEAEDDAPPGGQAPLARRPRTLLPGVLPERARPEFDEPARGGRGS